jgi:CRP-like cAMP-binding protein
VKIVLPSAEDEEPAIIATLRPGDFFGELALFDDAPRSATAIALGATETLVLRREVFLDLIDEDQSLRHALLSSLADEIRSITLHVGDLHFLDLPGRLGRRILREAESVVAEPDGAVRLPWPYTQAELAGMIGGSRQSVNRLLADLVARDLIRVERDVLLIPDPAALERSIRR